MVDIYSIFGFEEEKNYFPKLIIRSNTGKEIGFWIQPSVEKLSDDAVKVYCQIKYGYLFNDFSFVGINSTHIIVSKDTCEYELSGVFENLFYSEIFCVILKERASFASVEFDSYGKEMLTIEQVAHITSTIVIDNVRKILNGESSSLKKYDDEV